MAYTANVTSPMRVAERVSPSIGMYAGKVDITSYNTTLVEITAITKYFKPSGVSGFTKGLIAVVCPGVSDQGYTMEWDYTTGAFKAYLPTKIVFSGSATGANVTWDSALNAFQAVSKEGTHTAVSNEGSNNDDAGSISFLAIGFV